MILTLQVLVLLIEQTLAFSVKYFKFFEQNAKQKSLDLKME